jgi:LmbE family N-acetylglucosaminyl deacetylase
VGDLGVGEGKAPNGADLVLGVSLGGQGRQSLEILALGAHADDIEIGCGGTILKLTEAFPKCVVTWVVLSAEGQRADEARWSGEAFLRCAAERRLIIESFRDGFFPYSGADVKDFFERLKAEVAPDLIFTHYGSDLHQDHRLVSELTWNTFRDHLIFEYEVPKYDGDLGAPNVFVHLTQNIVQLKIEMIMSNFVSQSERHWFTEDVFRSTLRLRGLESNSPSRYAEGLYSRKLVL